MPEIPIPTEPYPEPGREPLSPEEPKPEYRFSNADIGLLIPVAILFDLIALLEFPDPLLGFIEFYYYRKKGFNMQLSFMNSGITMLIKLVPFLNWWPWYLTSFFVMLYIDRSPYAERFLEVAGRATSLKRLFSRPLQGETRESAEEIVSEETKIESPAAPAPQKEGENTVINGLPSPSPRSSAPSRTEQEYFGMPEENPLTQVHEDEFEKPVVKDQFVEEKQGLLEDPPQVRKDEFEKPVVKDQFVEEKQRLLEDPPRPPQEKTAEERKREENLEDRLDTGTAELRRIKDPLENLPFKERGGQIIDIQNSKPQGEHPDNTSEERRAA